MIGKSIGLVAFFSLSLNSLLTAQMGKVDTKHVADDAFCVIRVDVENVVKHLKDAKKEYERIVKSVKEATSIDVESLTCITLQFGDQKEDDREPGFAITFEFNKDFDQQEILDNFVDRRTYEKDAINGKTYMKADRQGGPHMYFESKRKFTAATLGGIKSILNSGGGMGQLSAQLKSAPPGSEMIFAFNRTDKFEEAIDDMAGPLMSIPGPFSMENLITQGESAIAVINLTSGVPIDIQLQMTNAKAAEKVAEELKTVIEMGKPLIEPTKAMLKAQMKDLGDEDRFEAMQKEAMAVGIKGLAVADRILNGVKVANKSKTVTISYKQMGGMSELADIVVQGMQMWVMGRTSSLDGPPPRAIDRAVEKSIEKK